MTLQFLAFDIETGKIIPEPASNWQSHRPLGITCIASQAVGDEKPRVWFSQDAKGHPASQMTREDIAAFVRHLGEAVQDGFMPLSWNGLAFDLDILAEESGLVTECKKLALGHVDMMFHVFCDRGYPVALDCAASGLGLPGKMAGVDGSLAPSLWAKGQYDTVLEYVSQDVRTTQAVAQESERRKRFLWRTKKGSVSSMPLPNGWLSVEDAQRLPLPDTSWMDAPIPRSTFTAWLNRGR